MNLPCTRARTVRTSIHSPGSIYLARFLFANRNNLNQMCVCGKGLLTLLPHHTHTCAVVHVVRKINIQAKPLRHTITSNECYYQKIRKVLFHFFRFHYSLECKRVLIFFGQSINHLRTKPLEIVQCTVYTFQRIHAISNQTKSHELHMNTNMNPCGVIN